MDIETIRENYKQLALESLKNNDYDGAIIHLNAWQYAYYTNNKTDTYIYDFDLLNKVDKSLDKFKYNTQIKPRDDGKICIVYLLHGMLNSTSVVLKIILDLIKGHDRSKFDIHLFVTESRFDVMRSSGNIYAKKFKEMGCPLHYPPIFKNGFSKIQAIASNINKLNPHILVTTAALADFNYYFIASLKPAPITVGFVLACPAQFVSPSFDYGISWVNHIKSNCPIPCLYSGQIYIPDNIERKNIKKSDYNIPDDAIIITSAGRTPKFQDDRVSKLIIELMYDLPKLHYVIVGPKSDEIPLSIPDALKDRVHIFNWSDKYTDYLMISDIYLDTFPSGGGMTLLDAALLKLPLISFHDSDTNTFDQADWNLAEEFFSPESILLINRKDISELKITISDLYLNKNFRDYMGDKAYNHVMVLRNNIPTNIKNIEKLYINIICGRKI